MNKAELLIDVIGEARDEYVYDVYKRASFLRTMRVVLRSSVAAALVFVMIGLFNIFGRLDYLSFGNCGNPTVTGTAVDGVLYYEVPHQGIYKYTPEKGSEQILWKYWYEEYTVNSYAVYYTRDDTVYSIPHRTGESKELFTAKGADEISVYPCGQDIIISFYIKDNYRNLLIDGKTGENLGTIRGFDMDPDTLKTKDIPQDAVYSVGKRKITVEKEREDSYSIIENGKKVLGTFESVHPLSDFSLGDCLLFGINNNYEVLILRPDGRDSTLIFYPEEGEGISGGDENYIFDSRFDDNIVCVNAYTGETWDIAKGKDFAYKSVLAADSDYLYITDNNTHESVSCWKISYDSKNRPESLKLVEGNILK